MNKGGSWPLAGRDAEMDAVGSALAGGTHDVIVLYGPAGVGKTRLADACASSTAAAAGRLTARVVATQSASMMPLGTLAPILPTTLGTDATPAALYGRVRDDLIALGGEAGLLLLVDDAHLLDTSSAVLLTQLLDARALTVLATIRDSERPPDAVANWWRRDRALRLDLQDLGADAAHEVLAVALGGAVTTETVRTLHQASGGNPLLLRELVHQALYDGQLDDSSGAWVLDGKITPSRRLIDVMSLRLGKLSTEERHVVDQLAVCAPLGPAELSGDVTAADLHALEASGLVRVAVDGRRYQLMLGHPIYGEALRADMTVLRRRAILLDIADRIDALGARRREDARRVATWRLDAGGRPDTDLLLQAARFARYANDHAQAERLATVLWSREPSVEVAVLLGEARYELGNFEAAEEVLATPLPADTPDALRVQWAWTRCVNLQFGLGNWEGALDVLRDAQRVVGPGFADELVCQEAEVWLFAGEPQKAVDLVAGLTPPTDRGRVLQALVCGQALPRVGRTQEGIEATTQGFQIHSAMTEPVALPHPGVHIVSHALALIDAGRFDEGAELVRGVYDITVADRNHYAQIFCAVILGRVDAIRGRLQEASRWFREAGSTGQLHGFGGHEHTARCGLAAAEAMMGNVEASNEAVARSEALSGFAFLRFDSVIGPAWNAWARGFTDEARSLLLEAAGEAAATGNVQSAVWLYQDASRLGARGLGSRMVALAESSDSPVVWSLARNVVAREAGDAAGLAAACEELELRGLVFLAAETAVATADAYRRDGDQRSAARWSARAKALADRCQGACTPDLVVTDAAVPLSSREREIAALAREGFSSQEIADRLFLSVRTVDNHLGKAYAKLGVTGRKDLAEALGGR